MTYASSSLELPDSGRSDAHSDWAQRAFAGTAAEFNRSSRRKKRPSRAIAKETRAPDRMSPFTQPKVETMIASAVAPAAAGPNSAVAEAVATRSAGAGRIPEGGGTFR